MKNNRYPVLSYYAMVRLFLAVGLVLSSGLAYAATRPPRLAPKALYSQLAHAAWFANGHGSKIIYEFFDPNCPYCNLLYHILLPRIAPNHLTVREVPVGYLTPTSMGKAAALLEAKNHLRAYIYNETHYSFMTGGGLVPVVPNARTRQEIDHNLKLVEAAVGYPIVPVLVYQKNNGKIVVMNAGVPTAIELAKIFPTIKNQ